AGRERLDAQHAPDGERRIGGLRVAGGEQGVGGGVQGVELVERRVEDAAHDQHVAPPHHLRRAGPANGDGGAAVGGVADVVEHAYRPARVGGGGDDRQVAAAGPRA